MRLSSLFRKCALLIGVENLYANRESALLTPHKEFLLGRNVSVGAFRVTALAHRINGQATLEFVNVGNSYSNPSFITAVFDSEANANDMSKQNDSLHHWLKTLLGLTFFSPPFFVRYTRNSKNVALNVDHHHKKLPLSCKNHEPAFATGVTVELPACITTMRLV